jgi:hypothetical protein
MDAYRDENESLREKNRVLEERIRDLERRPRLAKWIVLAGAAVVVTSAAVSAAMTEGRLRAASRVARTAEVSIEERAQTTTTTAAAPKGDLCAKQGVSLTVDGSDAFAPVAASGDLAGHKYHRGGNRDAWFTVAGPPIYVHGVGDSLSSDVGTTKLTLMTIMTKGENGGYRLARGGKSFLEVTRSDGKLIAGRFEADMSKVDETTREPPFGTPVVRVRGSFCLPAYPADPSDTGP